MPRRSTKIFQIDARELPKGGASCEARVFYNAEKESATTAIAKAMFALNAYAETMQSKIVLVPYDRETKRPVTINFEG